MGTRSLKMSTKNDRIVTVEQAILALESLTNTKIDAVKEALLEVKAGIVGIKENEIDHLEKQLTRLEDKIEGTVDKIEKKIDRLLYWILGAIAVAAINLAILLGKHVLG
jgi:predicted transcriptional regulator